VELSHETYRLEDIDQGHHIGAALFVPFTILRLRGGSDETATLLTVELRNMGNTAQRQRTLHLSWLPASVPAQPLGVP
jgi:hypothetical protein